MERLELLKTALLAAWELLNIKMDFGAFSVSFWNVVVALCLMGGIFWLISRVMD